MNNKPVERSQPEKDLQIKKWLFKIKELYGKDRAEKYLREEPGLRAYLSRLVSGSVLPSQYTLLDPISVGGSSVVFQSVHSALGLEFVVKFNRPIPEAAEMVENELNTLPKMNHSNIVRLVERGTAEAGIEGPRLFFLIEPLLKGIMNIDEYFESYISGESSSAGKELDHRTISNILLDRFTRILHQWVSSLGYIHSQGHVYLDVKPQNAVVDKDGHLFVIDFGTTQKLDPTDNTGISVFFTGTLDGHPLAYPWLLTQKGEQVSPSRLVRSIKRSDLHPKFDFYALGQSIIYLLKKVEEAFPSDSPQLPLFRSLHFIATRLLYGENKVQKQTSPLEGSKRSEIGEAFGGLLPDDYTSLKYESLHDVVRDLEKETGSWNPELIVPELENYSKANLRIVTGISTVLTPRLKRLIEHPLFARLKLVTELGLITLVYPTADQSRYDHILGSFTYTTRYIMSLFNDRENPIFRNLVDDRDISASLLASLLHDLGQYPLAHDLEEVYSPIFSHGKMSLRLLDEPTKDEQGDTLLTIMTDANNGWNVEPDWVRHILGAKSKQVKIAQYGRMSKEEFKVDMLSALIDGPIDADKADYIVRDSLRSGVPYGQQLDIERLLRVITIAVQGPPQSHKVTIGVYEKGRASAESFGFARYLLYASVYWHHTSRILKSMMQYATAMALPREVFNDAEHPLVSSIREDLTKFVVGLRPPYDFGQELPSSQRGKIAEKSESIIEEPPSRVLATLGEYGETPQKTVASENWFPGICITDWLMLRWIQNLAHSTSSQVAKTEDTPQVKKLASITADGAANLINSILKRQLYKRVATLPRDFLRSRDPRLVSELEKLSWPEKVRLCRTLQDDIYDSMKSRWKHVDTGPLTTQDAIDQLFARNLILLIDVPRPSEKIGFDRPLNIVPELRAKTYYQEVQHPEEAGRYRESLESLMETIAPVRVLCHPDVRQVISKNIENLRESFRETIHLELKTMGKLP